MHKVGSLENDVEDFPNLGFGELFVINTFFTIFDFTFKRIGKIVIDNLSK